MTAIDIPSYISVMCMFCRIKMPRESRMYARLKIKFCLHASDSRHIAEKLESTGVFRAKRKYADTCGVKINTLRDVRPQKIWERQLSRFLHNEQLARAFYQFWLSAIGNKRIFPRISADVKIGGVKSVKDRRMCEGVNTRDWIVLQCSHLYRLSRRVRICEIRIHAYIYRRE